MNISLRKILFSVFSLTCLTHAYGSSLTLNSNRCIVSELSPDGALSAYQDTKNRGLIPFIEAKNLSVYYCWGLIHAKMRGWQMQFLLQAAQGTRSEIYGPDYLKADFAARMLGLEARAQILTQTLSPKILDNLNQYVQGANDGFELYSDSYYELKKYPFKLQNWSVQAVLEILLIQSFDQSKKSIEQPIKEEKRLKTMSPGDLNRRDLPWTSAILKKGELEVPEKVAQEGRSEARQSALNLAFENDLDLKLWEPTQEKGSNSWVIGPSRTEHHAPILANDPHLALRHPAFWFWQIFKYQGKLIVGGSVPGVPVLANGFNGTVAWGLTNAYINAAEAFLVDKKNLGQIVSHFPLIWIKKWGIKWPMFFKRFEVSASTGLILPPIEIEHLKSHEKLAVDWAGLRIQTQDLEGIFNLIEMENVQDSKRLLSSISLPSWNFVFADTQGGIGYKTVGAQWDSDGQLGLKLSEKGLLTRAKDLKKSRDLPALLNPGRGFLVAANNQQSYDTHVFGRAQAQEFRAYEIEKEIIEVPKHTMKSISKIQCSVKIPDSEFLLSVLKPMLTLQDQDLFSNSKLEADMDCKLCPIYRGWISFILDEWAIDEGQLYHLLKNEKWKIENQTKIRDMFEKAMTRWVGSGRPKWGQIHFSRFLHQIGISETVWDPFGVPGDRNTINVSDDLRDLQESQNRLYQEHGASMRLIVELSKNAQIWIAPSGIGLDKNLEKNSPNVKKSIQGQASVWSHWQRCEYLKYGWKQLHKL